MENIEKLENRLWEAADQLRANSALTSTEYFMPVLGLIFLRHQSYRLFLLFKTSSKSILFVYHSTVPMKLSKPEL